MTVSESLSFVALPKRRRGWLELNVLTSATACAPGGPAFCRPAFVAIPSCVSGSMNCGLRYSLDSGLTRTVTGISVSQSLKSAKLADARILDLLRTCRARRGRA